MSLRRFLNLVTLNRQCCIYSICRMDMSRQHLFYPATPAEQKKLNLQDMKSIQIPPPSVSFKPNPSPCADDGEKMYCFGLSENKLICTDQSGLSFLYDARLDSSLIMPSLRGPKWCPISFSIPDPDEQEGGGGRLYIMEKSLRPCPDKEGRFEAFVYTKPDELCFEKIWCHHLLPLPPFVLEPGYKSTWICSHGVLGSGSHLCMSFKGIGTYCFNTETREWSHAGDWVLPLHGKAEYLPDLNLWFGFSEDRVPCVSDLSSALKGEKPELCSVSGYDYCPPDWKPLGLPQVVSLGSSRLCILDYFQTMLEDTCNWTGELVVDEKFAVLTGVELLACGNGNGNGAVTGSGKGKGLCMINHKSGIFRSGRTATIEAVL